MSASASQGEESFFYDGTLTAPVASSMCATYTDNRAVPLLLNSRSWKVALARLSLNGTCNGYPVWSTPVSSVAGLPGQMPEAVRVVAYYGSGVMSVGEPAYTVASASTFVPMQFPNSATPNALNEYESASYDLFATLLTTAISTACAQIFTAALFTGTGKASYPPVLCTYDAGSDLFSLNVREDVYLGAVATASPTELCGIGIVFNDALMRRMPFPLERRPISTLQQWGVTFPCLAVGPLCMTSVVLPGMPGMSNDTLTPYYRYTQEISQTANWCPYTGLSVTTSSIPSVAEQSGYNDGAVNSTSQSGASVPTLFDFTFVGGSAYTVGVSVTPNFYRWATLTGAGFSTIQLSFWLTRRNGRMVPLVMAPGSSLMFKLIFARSVRLG